MSLNLVSDCSDVTSLGCLSSERSGDLSESFLSANQLSYEQLKQEINESRKIQYRQKEELIKSAHQFQKFHEIYQKQNVLFTQFEQRVELEVANLKQKKETLQNRNTYLENLTRSNLKTIETLNSKLEEMLSTIQTKRIESCESKQNVGPNVYLISKIMIHFVKLETEWYKRQSLSREHMEDNTMLKNQIDCFNSQIKLLKQKINTTEAYCEKIKRRLQISEDIVQDCEKERMRMNQQIFQNSHPVKSDSPKDMIKLIGILRIEQAEYKRKNEDLLDQVQQLRDIIGQKPVLTFPSKKLQTRKYSSKSSCSTQQ